MNCFKTKAWYNPLFVAPDNDVLKYREVHAFYVFDKTGVILKHEHGWFSDKRGFEIENLACVKKMKVDFNCETAFLISHTPSFSSDGLQYDVYIPASALDIQKPVYKKNGSFIEKIYKTKIETVEFAEHRYLDTPLWEIWGKMEKCIEQLSHYNLGEHPDVFDKNLKELKKQRKKWDEALAYKQNYTVEMAIAEGF